MSSYHHQRDHLGQLVAVIDQGDGKNRKNGGRHEGKKDGKRKLEEQTEKWRDARGIQPYGTPQWTTEYCIIILHIPLGSSSVYRHS